jgi:hypothetical protein
MRKSVKPWDINVLQSEPDSGAQAPDSTYERPIDPKPGAKPMQAMGPDPSMLAARILGAVCGALVSLAYMMPKSAREAAARAIVGIASGLVFGGPAGVALAEKMGVTALLSPDETVLMGSAAASLAAWWVLGVLTRIADRTGRGAGPKP